MSRERVTFVCGTAMPTPAASSIATASAFTTGYGSVDRDSFAIQLVCVFVDEHLWARTADGGPVDQGVAEDLGKVATLDGLRGSVQLIEAGVLRAGYVLAGAGLEVEGTDAVRAGFQ